MQINNKNTNNNMQPKNKKKISAGIGILIIVLVFAGVLISAYGSELLTFMGLKKELPKEEPSKVKELPIALTAEAYLPESFADVEESYFRTDELLIKVKKEVKDKVKDKKPKDTGLASLNALNQKYKARKFERIVSPGPNSNPNADIYQWYKVTFEGPNDIVSAQQNPQTRKFVSKYPQAKKLQNIMNEFLKGPNIEAAEPNYLLSIVEVPNDPQYASGLWGMHKIAAEQAWDISTGSGDVIVTVIDTGLNRNHEDLAANAWVNGGEIPDNGIDDDSNGFIDDYHGWDFYHMENEPMDDHGHGSHCAGTIGAVGNNGIGVVGINWNVKIMPLKDFNSYGSGSTLGAIWSIQYTTMMKQNGIPIAAISASWGSKSYSQSMKDAILEAHEAGILFVGAAGNYSRNNDVAPFYPESYDLPNIISVAASDSNDNLASFSCYGPTSVDLAAPGVSIQSTILGNGYSYWNGTSMATPHVAGTAALMRAAFPGLSHLDIKNNILDGVDEIAVFAGKLLTEGRLNVYKALGGTVTSTPDTQPPSAPQNLTATAIGPSQVNLSWAASTDNVGVAGYNIYRESSYLASTGANNYTDNSVSPATTYEYYAKAYDLAGNYSDPSNTSSVTTPSEPSTDNTPPETSIASPQDGETVFGTVNVQVSASDNVGVDRVELYVDGVLFGTDNTYPYNFSWDTTQESNGQHDLQSKAYDTSENNVSSAIVVVTVNNVGDTTPPDITISSPKDGASLPSKGVVKVQAQASDPSGIQRIRIKIEGITIKNCWDTTTCRYSWNMKKVPAGTYTITVEATDKKNNLGIKSITVDKAK